MRRCRITEYLEFDYKFQRDEAHFIPLLLSAVGIEFYPILEAPTNIVKSY